MKLNAKKIFYKYFCVYVLKQSFFLIIKNDTRAMATATAKVVYAFPYLSAAGFALTVICALLSWIQIKRFKRNIRVRRYFLFYSFIFFLPKASQKKVTKASTCLFFSSER